MSKRINAFFLLLDENIEDDGAEPSSSRSSSHLAQETANPSWYSISIDASARATPAASTELPTSESISAPSEYFKRFFNETIMNYIIVRRPGLTGTYVPVWPGQSRFKHLSRCPVPVNKISRNFTLAKFSKLCIKFKIMHKIYKYSIKFAKLRPSAFRPVISFIVLSLSRIMPKKLW